MSALAASDNDLASRVQQYLDERRRLGFKMGSRAHTLPSFERFVSTTGHTGPLTVELMTQWARQVDAKRLVDGVVPCGTAARRLAALRPFIRWLRQFEPETEVPDDSSFGPLPGRVAPHIYSEVEIVALLAAARRLGPSDGLRAATYSTLFGLIASTGLRISEAINLNDPDVDLDGALLLVRQTKFAKSRKVPLHPSVIGPLASYRALRRQHVRPTPNTTFFVSSRGKRRGEPLGDRQVHRMFEQLRTQLGWVDRGDHGHPRIHDLRHTFAVRRLILWHAQGAELHQRMLALSTYMGHANIAHTYWYLSGVPELMALAGGQFERFADLGACDYE
jgi:integrase